MSGIFGVVSEGDCVDEVFFGTDYHSHYGKEKGGMAIFNGQSIEFDIQDINVFPFRSQLDKLRIKSKGNKGIGVISDFEPQPLFVNSHLGEYALAHVGRVNNIDNLVANAHKRRAHFREMSRGGVNPTEVVAHLINLGKNFSDGIQIMQKSVIGSSSVMLLSKEGIYIGRDEYGRTPINIGRKKGAFAACTDNSSFENLGFRHIDTLGPGEIGVLTQSGYEQINPPGHISQLCTFLLVYYGNPAAIFGGKTVEIARNDLGGFLTRRDADIIKSSDFVDGIPDSGTGCAIGYSNASGLKHLRAMVKYTETWQRSFMPQKQSDRGLVAKMKIIFIGEMIRGKRMIITDDSMVRGTQSQAKMDSFFREYGANEVHLRLSCPPLMFSCPYLNFSISESPDALAARKAIKVLKGPHFKDFDNYLDEESCDYEAMVNQIRRTVGPTTIKYQRLEDLVTATGMEKKDLCTYCWDGCTGGCK